MMMELVLLEAKMLTDVFMSWAVRSFQVALPSV